MSRKKLFQAILVGITVCTLSLDPANELYLRNRALLAFTDFILVPSAMPNDHRITSAEHLLDKLEKKFPKQRYARLFERANAIKRHLGESDNKKYYLGRRYSSMALEAMDEHNHKGAIKYFQNAIRVGTDQVKLESYLRLGALFHTKKDYDRSDQMMRLASTFALQKPMQFSGCSNLELVTGYIEERDIELNEDVHIVLIWKKADNARETYTLKTSSIEKDSENWDIYSWRGWTFQVGAAENLIPSGGFENITLPRAGHFSQLPMTLFRKQELTNTLAEYESTNARHNIVLLLDSNDSYSIGLGSPLTNHSDDNEEYDVAYLVTGQYKTTPHAQPRIGIRWWLSTAKSWEENVSEYFVDRSTTSWTRFMELHSAIDSTIKVQVWVINQTAAPSKVYVDNLGLFQVPLPC